MDRTRLDEILTAQLERTLMGTDLPDLGKRHLGETRDHYVDGNSRAIVVTDRLCAFDMVVGTVPFKGQVRNQLQQFWLEETASVAPNHLISVPDPNCMIVHQCRPLSAVFSVAGSGGEIALTREPCAAGDAALDEHLPRAGELARALFDVGRARAAERGLILEHSRYQFGVTSFGKLMVIGDVHTPASSRYGYADSADAGPDAPPPGRDHAHHWLVEESGFDGRGEPPDIPDAVRLEAARRHIADYERITGREFEPDTEDQPQTRVARNLGCI